VTAGGTRGFVIKNIVYSKILEFTIINIPYDFARPIRTPESPGFEYRKYY
jgi:hypothetical protein